jgi:hypothetical protein
VFALHINCFPFSVPVDARLTARANGWKSIQSDIPGGESRLISGKITPFDETVEMGKITTGAFLEKL